MKSVESYISNQSKPFYFALGFFIVAVLGLFDHITGSFSLAILYFLPIAMVTWYAGRRYGFIILLLSAGAAIIADLVDEAVDSSLLLGHLLLELLPLVVLFFLLAILKRVSEEHDTLKRVDRLTGTINARYFAELAEKEISRAKRSSNPLTVAYVELKNVDRGHDLFGEIIDKDRLMSFAHTLQSTVRTTDIIARIQVEGFALLLPDTCSSSAKVVLGKIRERAQELTNDPQDLLVVKMGAVTFSSPPESVDEMLLRTNSLIHSVKTSRKPVIKQASPAA